MLCDNCKQKQATTYVKTTINNKTTQFHLCDECAKQITSNMEKDFFDFSMGSLIDNLFALSLNESKLPERDNAVCPTCKTTFAQISNTGKLGCPDCYKKFSDRLANSLKRIHGGIEHKGKIPANRAVSKDIVAKETNELEKLKSLLDKAIKDEDFELACQLRDKIKAIKEEQ